MVENKTWNTIAIVSITFMLINYFIWKNVADPTSLMTGVISFIVLLVAAWQLQKSQKCEKDSGRT